jgi:putative glycerol kinase 5
MNGLHVGAGILHFFTRSQKFLAGSVIKLTNHQVTPRLIWVVENCKEFQQAMKENDAVFGTIESFLLHKLTGGRNEVVMDVTNAIAPGCYDPFTMSWAGWAINMFKFDRKIFPKVNFPLI